METSTPQTNKKLTSTIYIALVATWTALLLAVSVIPAYPILGTPASITFSSVLLSSLTAPLLGPLYGMSSGLIFGLLVPYVNPATSVGILTFLAPTLSALMGGLLLFNRWKGATIILVIQIAVWLATHLHSINLCQSSYGNLYLYFSSYLFPQYENGS